MKTLKEIQDVVAKEADYNTWADLRNDTSTDDYWPEVCRRAQLECGKATLDNACAIKVITELNYPHGELSESLILPEIEKLKKNSIKSLKNSLNLVSHGTCRRKANRLQ